jgi:CSLREA domain-containing protein
MKSVLLAALILAIAPLAAAETITVNSFDDLPDADLKDGVCDADLETEGLQCTLRAAVMHANVTAGPDTIELPTGFYKLKLKGQEEDDSATGDLDVLEALVIEGEGSAVTVVDGKSAKDRLFDVHEGASLTLRDVTLQRGRAFPLKLSDGVDNNGGGGVRVTEASLVLERVVVSRCKSFDDGGGIEVVESDVVLTDSTIERCTSSDDGGGLDADGSQVSMSGSTFFRNKCKDEGGALEMSGGQLNAENCTYFGNKAKREGGAFSLENGASTSLDFCTFLGNKSKRGAGISESDEVHGVNTTTATNTIFGDKKKANCDGLIGGSGNVDTGTTCGFDGTNLTDTKPLLKGAKFNGGATRTCELKPTSPCIDAAFVDPKEADCPETDQRGELRDADCDIGAYELLPDPA